MTSGRHRADTGNHVGLIAIAVLFSIAACSPSTPPASPAPSASPGVPGGPVLSALAESYVRLALQFAQHDPELVDAWRGPEAWRPGPREPVAPLLARLEALQRDVDSLPEEPGLQDRRSYLAAQLRALHMSANRLLGRPSGFRDEARASFGITPEPIDASALEEARAALEQELPGTGALPDRYAAYKRSMAIPAKRVEAVMRLALDTCRAAALRAIPLPADEHVDLVLVSGSAWDGYARYEGGHRTRVEINRDATLDVTRALRLACHEGYPGHHVQYMWIEDELVAKRNWLEFALVPAFGRHLLITEGAAEAGVDVLFPDPVRVAVFRDVLLPAAGLPRSAAARLVRVESLVARLEPIIGEVAGQYLDSAITQARAIERLRDEALTPSPESLLAFAERRRTRVLVYPEGRALVRRQIGENAIAGIRQLLIERPFAVQ